MNWLINLAARLLVPLVDLLLLLIGKPILSRLSRPLFKAEGRSFKRHDTLGEYREFRITLQNRRSVRTEGPIRIDLELQGGSWRDGGESSDPPLTVLHGPVRLGPPPRIELGTQNRATIHVERELRPMSSWLIICRAKANTTGISLWFSTSSQARTGEPDLLFQDYAALRQINGPPQSSLRTYVSAIGSSLIPILLVHQLSMGIDTYDILSRPTDYILASAASLYYALMAFSIYLWGHTPGRQNCGFVGDYPNNSSSQSGTSDNLPATQPRPKATTSGDAGKTPDDSDKTQVRIDDIVSGLLDKTKRSDKTQVRIDDIVSGLLDKTKRLLSVSWRSGLLLVLASVLTLATATLSLLVSYRLQHQDDEASRKFAENLLHREHEPRMATAYPGLFAHLLSLGDLQSDESDADWPDDIEAFLALEAQKLGSAKAPPLTLEPCGDHQLHGLPPARCTKAIGANHIIYVPPTMLNQDPPGELRNPKRMNKALNAASALVNGVGADPKGLLPAGTIHAYFVSTDGLFAMVGSSPDYSEHWLRYHQEHPLPRWEARPYVVPFHEYKLARTRYRSKTYIDIGGFGLVRTYCHRVRDSASDHRSIGVLCIDASIELGADTSRTSSVAPFHQDHFFDYWLVNLGVTDRRIELGSIVEGDQFDCMRQALAKYSLDELVKRGGVLVYKRDKNACEFDEAPNHDTRAKASRPRRSEYLILLSNRPERASFILMHPVAHEIQRDSVFWLIGGLLMIWLALGFLGLGFIRSQHQRTRIQQGAVLRDIPVGIVQLDADGLIVGANDRAEEILSCPLHRFDEDREVKREFTPSLMSLLHKQVLPLHGGEPQALGKVIKGSEHFDGFATLYGADTDGNDAWRSRLRFSFFPGADKRTFVLFDHVEAPRNSTTTQQQKDDNA